MLWFCQTLPQVVIPVHAGTAGLNNPDRTAVSGHEDTTCVRMPNDEGRLAPSNLDAGVQ